ncbi:hypothetical protein [Ruminiclostridium cellobioparum]|jgi:hypothetical protein|uniref:hypothetical protein n=2 Tax=Ruminiclostridium cellobioparum TaxID=29355 RepID=UPI0028A754D9|nr:hypothetical protein [Ruminiclostridium cellobioparum]
MKTEICGGMESNMGRVLDIDIYKNGFSADSVDCINGPVAAAAGYYSYEFYFYYCFLHCIYIQTSICDKLYNELNLDEYATLILENMGLALRKIDCTDMSDIEVISNISKVIMDGMPVVLVTKYNSLFYNTYYKSDTFKMNHAFIINEYLDDKNVFGIKESTLLRNIIDAYKNTDIFFPLHITEAMLSDIWKIANEQFILENSAFYKKFYSLEKKTHKVINTNFILMHAMKIFDNWNNELINFIDNYDKDGNFNKSTTEIDGLIEYFRKRYCGTLKPIYNLLYSCCDEDSAGYRKISEVEDRQFNLRTVVLTTLHKAMLKKRILPEDKRQKLKADVIDTDNEMISLINSFIVDDGGAGVDYHYIDISKMYNNQAFANCISDDSVASLTHDGLHYIIDNNVCCNTVWNQGNFSFIYEYKPEQYDNIACDGQTIAINGVEASKISLLACAEHGDFQLPINIEFENEEKIHIQADFSDFYIPPKYGEKIFWSGIAARRVDGKTHKFQFNGRLLAKTYEFRKKRVRKIELPVCKNVHIFAITLE